MIPTEGLIYSHTGQTVLAVLALIIGFVVWSALMIWTAGLRKATDFVLAASALRGGSPLIQQGLQGIVQRRPMRFWALLYAAFTVAPPILFLIGRTLVGIGDGLFAALSGWWPIIGISALVVAGGLVFWRISRRAQPDPYVSVETAAVSGPGRPVEPAPIWSAPPMVGNWQDPQG